LLTGAHDFLPLHCLLEFRGTGAYFAEYNSIILGLNFGQRLPDQVLADKMHDTVNFRELRHLGMDV
jgi:hypothetical protein